MTATAADALARTIADLQRRLAAVERTAQLPRSSIDGGALSVTDDTGAEVLRVGRQDDGTYAVAGMNGGIIQANDLELPDGSITETKIADDSISTPKLRADAVTTDKVAAGAITALEIAANTITAGNLAAGSITADRLAVGSAGGNLIPDPSFESAAMNATREGSWHFDTGSATPRYQGQNFAYVDGDATAYKTIFLTDYFPVTTGDVYTGSMAVLAPSPPTPNDQVSLGLEVTLQDGSLAFVAQGGASSASSTVWGLHGQTGTIPADAVKARVYLNTGASHTTGRWCVDAVSVRRVLPGVEIADGAITADKISAGAIDGQTIQSPNYVAGTAGFHLDGPTGAAEFNDATLRGELDIGPGFGSSVRVTRTIPSELDAYYTLARAATSLNYAVVEYISASAYWYEITFSTVTSGGLFTFRNRARGMVAFGQVIETSRESTRQDTLGNELTFLTVGPDASFTDGGTPEATGLSFQNVIANFGALQNGLEDLQFANVSLGRGVVLFDRITTAVSTTATAGAEKVVYTTPLIDWQPGRAYQVELYGQIKSGATQNPVVQIRKTNVSGAVLVGGPRIPIASTNTDAAAWRSGVVSNTGASVVTASLAVTVAPQVATLVTFDGTTGPNGPWIKVTDLGSTVRITEGISI